MSEMIGRVAKAIEAAARTTHDGYLIDPEAVARAAIAAMREPTKAMTDAVGDTVNAYYGGDEPLELYVWQGMIDEALK